MVTKAFVWKNPEGVVMGRLYLDKDANGLPVLQIEPEDDHYSGALNHESLFRLVTALAEDGIKR